MVKEALMPWSQNNFKGPLPWILLIGVIAAVVAITISGC